MSRRVLLAVLSVVLIVVAAAPWTITSSRIEASVARQVKALAGLDLAVDGRITIAFLPVPRVKLSGVTLTAPDGDKLVEGGQLRGEVRLLPLLAARLEINEIALSASRIAVRFGEDGRSPWDPTLARLRGFVRDGGSSDILVRRLSLADCVIEIRDARRPGLAAFTGVNLAASWPALNGALEAAGSFAWKDEPVSFSVSGIAPAALLSGQASAFQVSAKGVSGALSIAGEARIEPEFQAKGQTTASSGSLRDFARWSGLPVPLADRISAFALNGDFVATDREISWPSARLSVNKDRLDGSLSVLREAGRPLLRATLAGNQIDLTELAAPFAGIRSQRGHWVDDPFIPGMASAGNLDLRLSAGAAQIGRLKIDDMAAALLLTENRMEISLARAGIERGTLKGRVTLGIGSGFYDLKAQGAFDKVDVAGLFAQLGRKPWLSGTAQGQFAIDAFGESPADLVRQVAGKATLTLRQGELAGLAFDEVLRRSERRQGGASIEWRGPRTTFDQAQIGLHFVQGSGEITEGTLSGPSLRTALQGRVSLPDQMLVLRALTEGMFLTPNAAPVVLDITGPWSDLTILPSLEAAIRRSEAAPPLLAR